MIRLNDCYCDIFSYVLALLEANGAAVAHDTVREDLLGLLETAETRALAAGYAPEAVSDAKFAVCAWVDETILRSGWEGAKAWRTNQFQQRFFGTHNAGVEFFNRLEALGDEDAPARETYALCLGLGFHGEFFPDERQEALADIRRRVIGKATGTFRSNFEDNDQPLFPEAYQPEAAHAKKFNPWAFDWWFFLIPLLSVVLAAELYFLMRNDLNIQLLGFFGSIG